MTKPETTALYLLDLGALIREQAMDARKVRDHANAADVDYENGRLAAYHDVVSLMQQQAAAFGIRLSDLGLDGLSPEDELV